MKWNKFLLLKARWVYANVPVEQALTIENLLDAHHVRTEITQVDGYSYIRLLKKLP